MAITAPPQPPPLVTFADGDGIRRVRFRLWQVLLTAATIFTTTWFCTFGIIPAILALMVAKHILVAILIVGNDMPFERQGP
jgi:hypothetical protein